MTGGDNAPDACHLAPLDLITVERQVQQSGAYSALEWLLDSTMLPYPAYEQWRQGGISHLEDAIDADPGAWTRRLHEGESYARALGLVHEAQTYFDWRPRHGDRPLSLSPDPGRRELLAQRWVRPVDLSQLDLFLDNGASAAEHDLHRALAARNVVDAERIYERLCRIAPNHPGLGEYEGLVLYARHLEQLPAIPPDACAEEMDGLVQEILPLARARLRGQARDYLAPAWRRLAEGLPRDRFDPEHPDRHASHAQMQIPDWEAVMRSVQAVADHAEHPVLLARLAQALHHRQCPEAGMLAWARCCERTPEAFLADLARDAAPRLYRHALAFEALDEALDPVDFPAWLLLKEPGLLHHLDRVDTPVPAGASFLAVADLLRTRCSGGDEVVARRRLQELNPPLLRLYLARNP